MLSSTDFYFFLAFISFPPLLAFLSTINFRGKKVNEKIILIYAWLIPSYPLDNGLNINGRDKVRTLINYNFEIKWIQVMGANISDYPDFLTNI